MVLCIVPYCNAEAYFVIMLYYYPSRFAKKPSCKTVFRMCEKHARIISGNETVVKIQILN